MRRQLLVPIVLAFVNAGVLLAQDRPVVFVHGLASSGATWQDAAARLGSRLAITPYRPNLPWQKPYAEQASALQAQLGGLGTNTVAVAHSNGGIVARDWSRLHPLDGIVTLSSPHRGAPLFAHVSDWVGFNYLAFDFIAGIGSAFGSSYDDSWWVYAAVQGVLSYATQGAQDAILQLAGLVGFQYSLPIFPQMIPGSSTLADLNGQTSLGREASRVRARVGVVNVARNFYRGGVFRAIWPDAGDTISDTLHASAALLDFYALQLSSSPEPRDWSRAARLSDLAWWLWSHEEMWCRTVSDPSPAAYSALGYCAENDTLVPTWSQVYPGAVNIERRNTPAHQQQARQMDGTIQEMLTTFMHVSLRGAPPTSPPSDGAGGDPPRDRLYPGDVLRANDSVVAANRSYYALYHPDGNFILYRSDGAGVWGSRTNGTGAGTVEMQRDGNFVIYDPQHVPVWASGTAGYPGSWFTVQVDGNMVIYAASGAPVWASNTVGR